MNMKSHKTLAALLIITAASALAWDQANTKDAVTEKEALAEFNGLIGEWRGVGMPKRGSRAGAWIETGEWNWDFSKGGTAIKYSTKKGKQISSARVTWDAKSNEYQMQAELDGDVKRTYRGQFEEKKLVLTSKPDADGEIHQLTITPLNEKRSIVLYEKKRAGGSFYYRVAEVGYTRKGTSLAVAGAGEPQCIVTGGKGTIKVSYQGKTYYVCCTGCKQAFDDDPAGVIKDYEERLAAKKKSK